MHPREMRKREAAAFASLEQSLERVADAVGAPLNIQRPTHRNGALDMLFQVEALAEMARMVADKVEAGKADEPPDVQYLAFDYTAIDGITAAQSEAIRDGGYATPFDLLDLYDDEGSLDRLSDLDGVGGATIEKLTAFLDGWREQDLADSAAAEQGPEAD